MNELVFDAAPASPLVIGATGDAELMQNVRVIVQTFAYSVRFDVPFADTGDYIDSPLPLATAQRIAALSAAIEKYEPRLKVKSITFKNDPQAAAQGIGYPVIRLLKKEQTP